MHIYTKPHPLMGLWTPTAPLHTYGPSMDSRAKTVSYAFLAVFISLKNLDWNRKSAISEFLCKRESFFFFLNIKVRKFFMMAISFLRRRQWQPTPVLLHGKSHGQRGLVGCSSWGHKELDTTERCHFHFSLSCIGEGNGNPLQCSCLENPRDGGAWWAAVYGVAQSRT